MAFSEVEAGKKQLKTSIYMAAENGAAVVEDMAVQALLSKKIVDLLTVSCTASITTKIACLFVHTTKIACLFVHTTKIACLFVHTAKIASLFVHTTKIACLLVYTQRLEPA